MRQIHRSASIVVSSGTTLSPGKESQWAMRVGLLAFPRTRLCSLPTQSMHRLRHMQLTAGHRAHAHAMGSRSQPSDQAVTRMKHRCS